MNRSLLVYLTATLLPPAVVAAPECPSEVPISYAVMTEAIGNWEVKNSVALSLPAKRQTTEQFCEAALVVVKEKVADVPATERVAGMAISDYLDRHSGRGGKPRSMSASLRDALGASGLSRPQLQRFSLLKVSYSRPVDAVMLDKERYPKRDSYLMPQGIFLVEGLSSATVVCSGKVDVKSGVDSQFGC
jgi:hypothetical protein